MSVTPTVFSIHEAAKEGHVAWLKKASKRDLNKGDGDGWTAMHWGAWNGNATSLQTIIDRGGEVNKPDIKGNTPLHIAATYGNLNSIEMLISNHANLFSLDNNGRTAARVAAYYQKAECCRYLDTLSMRWQQQNEDAVAKLQIKAMKELKKRSKKSMEDTKNGPRKISYSYATAPSAPLHQSGGMRDHHHGNGDRRASASDELTGNRKLTQEDALRQNFELRSSMDQPSSSTTEKKTSEDASNSAGSTFRNLPRKHTGPLLNSLAQLPLKYEPPDDARHSLNPYLGSSLQGHSRKKKSLPELELTGGHPTETLNESALATFLHSLDLVDCVSHLHREKLDIDALNLCSEEDLISIGLSLGPRKKILNAIDRRKAVLAAGGGKLTDTEF